MRGLFNQDTDTLHGWRDAHKPAVSACAQLWVAGFPVCHVAYAAQLVARQHSSRTWICHVAYEFPTGLNRWYIAYQISEHRVNPKATNVTLHAHHARLITTVIAADTFTPDISRLSDSPAPVRTAGRWRCAGQSGPATGFRDNLAGLHQLLRWAHSECSSPQTDRGRLQPDLVPLSVYCGRRECSVTVRLVVADSEMMRG